MLEATWGGECPPGRLRLEQASAAAVATDKEILDLVSMECSDDVVDIHGGRRLQQSGAKMAVVPQ
jgi:hypothetical protein